ncbi:phage core tail protein [Apilactobacillus ozensis DSM 23829 = JCM 17196]|uniref:Phage core tail protein n=1 Tax=Apilactobacillus ozensis DSM 23829 = JCM 17196 TaxID=1423781 RepID=A0A0R2AQU9_9LACO|nr:phage tail tube protein [Apilactobacillus ozensis]KRM69223.1 phage core tail protein [Apilactobacillus ozensis DSM 23829 = JCM 17196]
MPLNEFMNGRDAISTKDAKVFMKIGDQIIVMSDTNKIKLKIEKKKTDVATFGDHWKKKKVTGVEGTGSLSGYLISSRWLKYGLPYVQGGQDLYFTIQVEVEDKTSKSGRQVVTVGEVNLDDIPIIDAEADDGVMEWESDLTFENIHLDTPFDEQ